MIPVSLFVVVVLLVLVIAAFVGYCVGYSLGTIDGKYQERVNVSKWAAQNGHGEVMQHLVCQSLKDAVG